MKYRNLVAILSALAILSLILWGKTALENAREGILICIQSLIPTLLPFFLISSLLTHSIAGTRTRCLSALEKLCSIPAGSGIYLVIGFLGGYPAGAANVSEGYRNGQLSRSDAERMLPFCSNAGPSFLFGILGPMFPKWWMPWLLWFVHIASAVFTAILIPGKPGKCMENRHPQILTLPSALEKALRVMATVCGWVVMFRILLGFIMPPLTRITSADHAVFLTGLLDLANGCLELGKIPDTGVKLVTASAMLSFGGLCVAMQTCSVCQDLSMKYYLSGKLIQAAVSILLISILVSGFAIGDLPSWTVAAIFPGIMAALNLRISAKIRVAFRR